MYHDLFVNIGFDESMQQNFFRERCSKLGEHAVIAYDSSTVSTYSGRQNEARYGYNKAKDGLKAIKLLTLYSIESRQPVAFTNILAIVHNTERVVYMNEGRNKHKCAHRRLRIIFR